MMPVGARRRRHCSFVAVAAGQRRTPRPRAGAASASAAGAGGGRRASCCLPRWSTSSSRCSWGRAGVDSSSLKWEEKSDRRGRKLQSRRKNSLVSALLILFGVAEVTKKKRARRRRRAFSLSLSIIAFAPFLPTLSSLLLRGREGDEEKSNVRVVDLGNS